MYEVARWHPQMMHTEMLTPEPIGVGTTFRVRVGRGVGDGAVNHTKINRPRSWAAISRSRALDAENRRDRAHARKELRPVITRGARAINELFDGDTNR